MKYFAHLATLSALIVGAGIGTSTIAGPLITVTHTGTVLSGDDTSGLFGARGADLSGLSFTLSYVFDLSGGEMFTYDYGDYGSGVDYTPSLATASLTIGGQTFSFSSTDSDFGHGLVPYLGAVTVSDSITSDAYFLFSEVASTDAFTGLDFTTPFSHTLTDADYALGGSSDSFYSAATGSYIYLNDETISSDGGSPATRQAADAPVPELASWAMMVGGFGLVGAAMRRRKVGVSFG